MRILLKLCCLLLVAFQAAEAELPWRPFDAKVFQQARLEQKSVLLNLEAVWCHWCHVMEQQTYANPEVQALLLSRFILTKADQDARPDLAARYRDWGWPATIIFDSSGREISKSSGFMPPGEMLEVLQRALEREPHKSASKAEVETISGQGLTSQTRTKLQQAHFDTYDFRLGGLKFKKKFLDADSIELALQRAYRGDQREAQMARMTLTANLKLLDPAWGGMYQYSTHGDWDHPHFEKIIPTQAKNIKFYALGAAVLKDPALIEAAKRIFNYLKQHLQSPGGAFYVSQDADLKKGQSGAAYFALSAVKRAKLGEPAVDRHLYSKENGLVVEALCTLYSVSGDAQVLGAAKRAAEWIMLHRGNKEGGYKHGERDAGGPYLIDSLAMARAFLALYAVSAEKKWLKAAETTGRFMINHFQDPTAGYIAGLNDPLNSISVARSVDDNVAAARFFNLLHHYLGSAEMKSAAQHALNYISLDSVALDDATNEGILLAEQELGAYPTHIAIVGSKRDPAARRLFGAALAVPVVYRRIEWYDAAEGPLANPDISYPDLGRSSAFVCSAGRCSVPIFSPSGVEQTVIAFQNRPTT